MSLAAAQRADPGISTMEGQARLPKILVFDSGLGGLTVFAEIARLRPRAHYLYAADDAVFPYGALSEADLVDRVLALMERLIGLHRPDVVVVACHTASTLVLPPLRARWPELPFVGTVPAIKPAAAASQSRMISVLATPGHGGPRIYARTDPQLCGRVPGDPGGSAQTRRPGGSIHARRGGAG